jgi:hypothetical protein
MVSEAGGAEPKWELFDLSMDYSQKNDVAAQHPDIVKELGAAFDKWWSDCLPLMVNEKAVAPKINPFQERFYAQFGGSPTPEDLAKMDPARSMEPGKRAPKK